MRPINLIAGVAMSAIVIICGPATATENSEHIKRQLVGSVDEIEDTVETLVRNNMSLTATEAEKFWPVYRDYRRAMSKNTKRGLQWITNYADAYNKGGVDTETMRKLLNDFFEFEKRTTEVRSRFVSQFADVLPAPKVLRFYQVDHRIDLWVRSNLAEQIPLSE
jgi:hypothetical protein